MRYSSLPKLAASLDLSQTSRKPIVAIGEISVDNE